MCNLLIHFKDYDEGNGFDDSWSMMTHDESLFISKVEHEKTHKKLLEYVNYGLSIMRQKNQKN